MFAPFFDRLCDAGIPVSPREYLAFLEGLSAGLETNDIDGFYYLARTTPWDSIQAFEVPQGRGSDDAVLRTVADPYRARQ